MIGYTVMVRSKEVMLRMIFSTLQLTICSPGGLKAEPQGAALIVVRRAVLLHGRINRSPE